MTKLTGRFGRVAIIAVLLMVGIATLSFAEYNQDHVKRVMRNNGAQMGSISKAMEESDWFGAAAGLYEIASGMIAIMAYTPPQGSKADWDKTMTEFVNAALVGIGACGAQDAEGLQAAFGTLRQLNRQGHGDHKPRS